MEYLWEKLYQAAYHRLRMANLAVLDLCLWDIIGKAKDEPVYRLLGGPMRDRVRAYAGHARLLDRAGARRRALAGVRGAGVHGAEVVPAVQRAGRQGGAAAERGAGQGGPRGGRPGRRHHGGLPALRPEAELDPVRDRPGAAAGGVLPDLAGGAAQLRRPGRPREAGGLDAASRWRSASTSTPAGRSARSSRAARRRCSSRTRTRPAASPRCGRSWRWPRRTASRSCRTPTSRAGTRSTCCSPTRSGPARSASGARKINANVQYFYRDWYEPKDGYFEPPAGPGFGYELDEGKIRSRVEL